MTDFFRFPHTPHIAWLAAGTPREDKVLSANEVASLLSGEVVVEEKLDGANLGISLRSNGVLLAQNRGQYLAEPYAGQFARLSAWFAVHGESLRSVLNEDLVLFGEWCAARHSLDYGALPDWFLLFDVYDRRSSQFWNKARRDTLAACAGLMTAPQITRGTITLPALKALVATTSSRYRPGAVEGVVIRKESSEWCEDRAKLVRPDFSQAIDTHWRRRVIEWNRVSVVVSH